MKTIEKAVKEYIREIKKDFPNEVHSSSSIMADFKAGVEFAQRWIPVEEELPENRTEIIGKNEAYKECFFLHEDGYRDNEYLKLHFTHWRPIEIK